MSIVSPGYLIADRGSNSSDADKVWTFYLKKRPDVHKELMEELITGEYCHLPSSNNPAIKQKLERAQMLLKQGQAKLDEMPDETEQKDESRLEDVIEEMKKILADVPQAWRYQISQPISISTLDNRLKLFIGKVKAKYGKTIDWHTFRKSGRIFFDIHYSPGD
jgi:hypothetical protein